MGVDINRTRTARSNRFVLGAAAGVAALALSGRTMAQTSAPPSPIDLRAAYCARALTLREAALNELVKVLVSTREYAEASDEARRKLHELEATQHSEIRDLRAKVLSYLTPRLQYLDVAALLQAVKQADADQERAMRAGTNAGCYRDIETGSACAERVTPPDIAQSTAACSNLTWLPY